MSCTEVGYHSIPWQRGVASVALQVELLPTVGLQCVLFEEHYPT